MIPANIERRHVELALDVVDRDGVPRGRESRRFTLHERGRLYPPKYVLAVANKFANRRILPSADFSGGLETNDFLQRLGYKITPASRATAPRALVATVLWRTTRSYDTRSRFASMQAVLNAVRSNHAAPTLFLFPGGWLKAPEPKSADSILDRTVAKVRSFLAKSPGCTMSFGLDGSRSKQGTRDQLAIAVDSAGILAIGRKFHRAPGETIRTASCWDGGEHGYERSFRFGTKRYFLAICYDGFGIKHLHLPRPRVDAILDHVHGFWPRESPVLFARHGFAGAAQEWQVPVYGAAVFYRREIPTSWPSAVRWKGPPRSTMEWKYVDNPLMPIDTVHVSAGDGVADVRLFRA